MSAYRMNLNFARQSAHPYAKAYSGSHKHSSNTPMLEEIVSPAVSQSNITPSMQPQRIWEEWGQVYACKLGPFRVPVEKIRFSKHCRDHTSLDIDDLANAMSQNDQRALRPVLVEFYPDVINESDFEHLSNDVAPLTQLPEGILTKAHYLGFLIHGAKRYQAVHLMEDSFLYVYFLGPGMCIILPLYAYF